MRLADHVHVSRRFQRAIRVDTDLEDPLALEGFICPQSSAAVLETMALHTSESGQGAFTWTGPYGSGKSSLIVALSALLGKDGLMRENAAVAIGRSTAQEIWDAMPPKTKGWAILPIVGRRERPEQLVGEAINHRKLRARRRRLWSEKQALDAVLEIASRDPTNTGGLLVVVDEMGKILEGAAHNRSDVYFFQQLAELASRSDRRLIIVGILHQAFEEYSHRLSREMREEWSKIQGRYVDLPVNVAADEQIGLLGRAIDTDRGPVEPSDLSIEVAALTNRPFSHDLPTLLEECWPLHPVVASLLGPVSRRRFGQNQRSIFGFLNSAEPRGFQDFLRREDRDNLYEPHFLWDYLRLNLEPSIMASPDSHRWALAVDALERCHALGGQDIHLRLLETIALVDLFKERSGLVPSLDLLSCSLPDLPRDEVAKGLNQLQKWSLVIYRKFSESYSIFEGSDFDVEEAVGRVLETMEGIDFENLNTIAGLRPIVAKRHYHDTGAMRWFDVAIAPLADVRSHPDGYAPTNDGVGTFILGVATQGEPWETARQAATEAVAGDRVWDLVVGLPQEAWDFASLARELIATEKVRDEFPQLQGDRVARREVEGRVASLRSYLEAEIERAFDNALWHSPSEGPERLTYAQLNGLASRLADRRFSLAPRLHNELLNRVKPSSNAVAAHNILLRQMALHEGRERLGIRGFPAEGGLFVSLLEKSGLYRKTRTGWCFVSPTGGEHDPCNLAPAWVKATEFLEANEHRTVALSEIYDVWRKQPFGIKDGLLQILASAFILSRKRQIAFYRQNVFQSRITDLDMDYLAKDPSDIQLRWMNLSDESRHLLSALADIVRSLDGPNDLSDLEPIDVAKGLVAIYDRLPQWVGRTQRLSDNAKRVRQLFKQASDPNSLIFDDIPQILGDVMEQGRENILTAASDGVREGLKELQQAYAAMLNRLQETLLSELQVPNASPPMLAELRGRAENVRELSGDHRMEAFVMRLVQFTANEEDVEGLASMIASKPPSTWVDGDIDRVTVEMAEMSQRFMRMESYAHVKGRANKRHSMAVTVGLSGRPATVQNEFDISSLDQPEVESLVAQLQHTMRTVGEDRQNVILAALAELSSLYLNPVQFDGERRLTN